MSDVERLIAIQQIQELQARRCYALDHGDWTTYEALHAPDHVSHSQDEQRWEGAKANTARVAEAKKGKTSMHHLHSPIITIESTTKASGIWSMEDHI
jgi:SnoaL-like domain